MCDTFVALGNSTSDGSVIFGKNSDRDPNEAHELILIPHALHPEGELVDCTYIKVPQVRETQTVLLSKPFWIWGAEMGANESGVVIGNEAVFTRVPYEKGPGLIGMDFLRLALERSCTAEQALEVLISLLETYGQGGNCGFAHKMYYHNSFLIADHSAAWVLETAGRQWAAQRVQDIRSISNVITIGSEWDRASDRLVDMALEQGWCKSRSAFSFSQCYSDFIYTNFSAARHRHCRTTELLKSAQGHINLPYAMQVLRDHGSELSDQWTPAQGLTGAQVCMHASFGPVRINQTTGSMVAHLMPQADTFWLTGTAAPCTSTFKPVQIAAGLPDHGPQPGGSYDDQSLWWRHENLHREILRDYAGRMAVGKLKRDALELGFIHQNQSGFATAEEAASFTASCFEKIGQFEADWLAEIKQMPVTRRRPLLDQWAWRKLDRQAARPT